MKIIVTDVDSRKTFDVVNILQHVYKYNLILCASRDYKFQLRLIYNQKIHRLRVDDLNEFGSDLDKILEQFGHEELVYIPLSDLTTKNMYQYLRVNSIPNLHSLLPAESDYYLTCDKIKFQKYCEQQGYPVPESYTAEDVKSFHENFVPLIVKPFIGAGSVGIKHIDVEKQLEILDNIDLDNYIVQRKIISMEKVSGAFFLCKAGDVVSVYTHQRLRTFPSNGGVTVYSTSTENSQIIDIGSDILKKMSWNGFAMIEFMFDQATQEWKVIELNPRLWGSVLLSTFIGNHMLKEYVNLCVGSPVSENNNELKKGYIRWIYPFDLLNLFKGEVGIMEFFKLNTKETGYINFTYSKPLRSLLFIIYFSFNVNSITRLFKKIF